MRASIIISCLLILAGTGLADTNYVSLTGNHVSPFTNWLDAATNVQDAVDAASDGDTVLVTNGVYDTGGRAIYGEMTNRVAIDRAVTVRSMTGPELTVIEGQGPLGDGAVRCAYVGTNALLEGFTLSNGCTRAEGDVDSEQSGGGAWCESAGMVSNCVLAGNSACYGGGAYGGTQYNCTLSGNSASVYGSGAYGCTLYDCTLAGNSGAFVGGGAYGGTLSNCVLIGNSAIISGGGADGCALYQCTVSSNSSDYGGGAYGCTQYNCTISSNSAGYGGGAYECALYNCDVSSNSADYGGGACLGALSNCTLSANLASHGAGSFGSMLYNCLSSGNLAEYGAGAYGGTLYNSTLSANSAAASGGGSYASTAYNSVFYHNSAPTGSNWTLGTLSYCCTTPLPGGTGNITNAPLFVDTNAADYRLQTGSPCINAGTNQPWMAGATDLDGLLRIIGGRVDMGAYESTNGTTARGVAWGWLLDHGLATDGSEDGTDSDNDGMDARDEYFADTDPANLTSRLAITGIRSLPGGIRIDWQGGVGAWQYVQQADALGPTGSEWRAIFTNSPPTSVATNFTHDAAACTNAFYRIRAARTDN